MIIIFSVQLHIHVDTTISYVVPSPVTSVPASPVVTVTTLLSNTGTSTLPLHVRAFCYLTLLAYEQSRAGPASKNKIQESRAVARKPREAAAVHLGLKFADDIDYKFKSIAKLRIPGFRASNIPAKKSLTQNGHSSYST